ncbi:jg20746 [Pararge aegeria aegeria]|uniref:Jg20746 protein n=1 Tax=Pararge aegeria aegeria TaxID=348720 RepID=A0A8S4RY22_9NEOP|nr:jg20746 [Pararge aegeria aegeria]
MAVAASNSDDDDKDDAMPNGTSCEIYNFIRLLPEINKCQIIDGMQKRADSAARSPPPALEENGRFLRNNELGILTSPHKGAGFSNVN